MENKIKMLKIIRYGPVNSRVLLSDGTSIRLPNSVAYCCCGKIVPKEFLWSYRRTKDHKKIYKYKKRELLAKRKKEKNNGE